MGVMPPWDESVVTPNPIKKKMKTTHKGSFKIPSKIESPKKPQYNCPIHGDVYDVTLTISSEGGTGFIAKFEHNYCLYCIDDLLMEHVGELPLARPTDWMTNVVKEDDKNALHKKS
jgi:hypothetical protein